MSTIMEDTQIEVVPDIENWSENFALAVFDPIRNIHLIFHIGRWRKDRSLWRECMTISLPNGTTIYHRAIGNARASASGPGGPCFSLDVIENHRQLRWSFLGGARRIPTELACNNLPDDGPLDRVEFDLLFSSDQPIWDIAQMGEQSHPIVRGHTEQIGLVKGDIKVGDEVFHFEGIGNRDHTRGPRLQKEKPKSHLWMHGTFENDVRFLAYEMMMGDKPTMSEACVYDGGQLYPASFARDLYIPRNGIDVLQKPFSATVGYEKGTLEVDVTGFPATNFSQYTAPWDFYVGRRQLGADVDRCVAQQSAHMTLGGSIKGYGHIERSLPGSIIFDPI